MGGFPSARRFKISVRSNSDSTKNRFKYTKQKRNIIVHGREREKKKTRRTEGIFRFALINFFVVDYQHFCFHLNERRNKYQLGF